MCFTPFNRNRNCGIIAFISQKKIMETHRAAAASSLRGPRPATWPCRMCWRSRPHQGRVTGGSFNRNRGPVVSLCILEPCPAPPSLLPLWRFLLLRLLSLSLLCLLLLTSSVDIFLNFLPRHRVCLRPLWSHLFCALWQAPNRDTFKQQENLSHLSHSYIE